MTLQIVTQLRRDDNIRFLAAFPNCPGFNATESTTNKNFSLNFKNYGRQKYFKVLIGAIPLCYPVSVSTKRLFNPVGTQQIIHYQSMNVATCFGSLRHLQANSLTTLKVRSVDVHIVGSQMFTNRMTFYCHTICKHLGSHNVHIN
jgi:hypothetical protein